jgi:hypothetical protein
MHAAPSSATPVSDETSAAVTISYVNKILRPVVFASPLCNFNFPHPGVHQHQASGTQQRLLSASLILAVTVPRSFSLESAFKVSPPFHHPGKKIRALRSKSGIKSQRHP